MFLDLVKFPDLIFLTNPDLTDPDFVSRFDIFNKSIQKLSNIHYNKVQDFTNFPQNNTCSFCCLLFATFTRKYYIYLTYIT